MIRDVADSEWERLESGRFEFRVSLPARLLNEGSYRVELLASLHFREWLTAPGNAPTVEFTIHGRLSDSPYWHMKRPGVLAPVLRWDITAADASTRKAAEHIGTD